MWNKPWTFAEGFLIGGGLLAVGLLLQVVLGPVQWDLLAWPVNIILLVLFLVMLGIMYALRRKVYLFEWMMHLGAAVPALCYALGLTIIMGLVAQYDGEGEAPGRIPWLSQMLNFWPFVLSYVWLTVIAGLASINHLLRFRLKEIPFLLNHLGLFVALIGGTLGSPDKQELLMTVNEGETEWRAETEIGGIVEPGIAIELHDFIMEEYPLQPGARMRMPKRFASEVTVYTQSGGRIINTVIDVNKPLKVEGWKIYQYGYDEQAGTESQVSILQLVKDPWIVVVYIGIYMMLAGAMLLFFFMAPRPKRKEE